MKQIKFESRFKDAILDFTKVQTVRDERKADVGDIVEFVCDGEVFETAKITAVKEVEFGEIDMKLDGRTLMSVLHSRDQAEPTDSEFAEASGFHSFMDMLHYYEDRYEAKPFKGFVHEFTLEY